MSDWLRANMDPDDPGSQGYSGPAPAAELARRLEIQLAIETLRDYWLTHPELRLGQITSNATAMFSDRADVFYIPDTDLMVGLSRLP